MTRWVFHAGRCLRLTPHGECYEVWDNSDRLGVICPLACSLEYHDELLWSPALIASAKAAARRLADTQY